MQNWLRKNKKYLQKSAGVKRANYSESREATVAMKVGILATVRVGESE